CQPWKALEGRVRGEHEDQERRYLNRVVEEATGRSGGERRAGDLRDDRRSLARHGVLLDGEKRDPEEERDRDRAEDRQGSRGVPSLRMPERIDTVCDGLDAGQRGRA